ncbi:MAG: hypothetical protein H6709_04545 [Kofleriaceae bacterium]|nr:hypothetical protein [Kofleriaceae bacterium]
MIPAPLPPAPAPAPKKARGPVTVAPNAVTKVSGEVPTIRAVVRNNETVPSVVAAKMCIDTTGRVTSVDVMKVTGDIATKLAAALRGWRYAPYKQGGIATPACFATTFKLK